MRSIVGEIVSGAEQVTVMDMEASIEHMSRGTVRHADVLLLALEPYYRSMETAGRIAPLARGLGVKRIYGVANKIRGPQDADSVRAYCRNHDLELAAVIPFDENVVEADRTGRAVIDYDVTSPIVQELSRLAERLAREISAGGDGEGGESNA